MEFMKIVHMGLNNRHLRPKSGGYFHPTNATDVLTAPLHSQRHLSDVPDIQPSVNVVHFEGDPVPASSQRRKPKVDMTPLDDLPPPMPATPTPPPPPLSLSVEEIVIPDDSLTAELLNEQVWLIVNSEEVWLWWNNEIFEIFQKFKPCQSLFDFLESSFSTEAFWIFEALLWFDEIFQYLRLNYRMLFNVTFVGAKQWQIDELFIRLDKSNGNWHGNSHVSSLLGTCFHFLCYFNHWIRFWTSWIYNEPTSLTNIISICQWKSLEIHQFAQIPTIPIERTECK